MIAYTVTEQGKIWIVDETNGDTIPDWCKSTDGYFIVDNKDDLPENVKHKLLKQETEQKRAEMNVSIQNMLDKKAQEFRYDSILSARSYVGFNNPFKNEAQALATWSANCWAKASEIEADVLSGKREMPTIEQVLSEMPEFNESENE